MTDIKVKQTHIKTNSRRKYKQTDIKIPRHRQNYKTDRQKDKH